MHPLPSSSFHVNPEDRFRVMRSSNRQLTCGNLITNTEVEKVSEAAKELCRKLFCLRERSFLILGAGAEDFLQGYETFFHYFVWVRKL